MWNPVHVDGRTVVVLIQRDSFEGGYDVVASGELKYDGQEIRLASEVGSRVISDEELAALQPVTPQNQISACRSFDFFLLQSPKLDQNCRD
jgi:hypothetical protein